MLSPSPLDKRHSAARSSSSDIVGLSVSQLLNPLCDFLVRHDTIVAIPSDPLNLPPVSKPKLTVCNTYDNYGSDDDTYVGDDSWCSGTSELSISFSSSLDIDDDENHLDDGGDPASSPVTEGQPGFSRPRRRVTFARDDALETTVLIPHFRDYEPEERNSIWSSCDEVDAIRERAIKEFLYEGWDWRSVLEDDRFIPVRVSSDYTIMVHPASVSDFMRQLQEIKQAARERARSEWYLAHKQRARQERVHDERECATTSRGHESKKRSTQSRRARSANIQRKRVSSQKQQQYRLPRSAQPSLTRFSDT